MSGFVGSERSGASLSLYGFAKRGLSFYSRGIGNGLATSRTIDGTDGLELISLSSTTSMGAGSGWQALLKYPKGFNPLEEIELGSWAYVSFLRDGVSYVTCIGRLTQRSVQENSAGGAVSRLCSLAGGGFEMIWKQTKWWFNTLRPSPENVSNSVIQSVGSEYLLGNPTANVEAVLIKFLRIMAGFGRAPYEFPSTMPASGDNILDAVVYDDTAYDTTTLPISQPIASSTYPNVDLWSMAQEYQDGMFTEMWADVLPAGGMKAYAANPDMPDGLSTQAAEMTVTFRDKPFAMVSSGKGIGRGRLSPYFTLPTHVLKREVVPAIALSSSEEEVFNAFSFSNMGAQEATLSSIEAGYVNWSLTGLAEQGLKKLDSTSMYFSPNLAAQYDYNRKRMRDWYCLGKDLFSGSLPLARGFPQIKVGSRVVVEGDTPSENITFYVESVRHAWGAGSGMRTTLDVTRGYRGTDAQHLARLESEVLNYADSGKDSL